MLGEEDCEERDYYQQGGIQQLKAVLCTASNRKNFPGSEQCLSVDVLLIEESKLNTKENFSRECSTYELVPT